MGPAKVLWLEDDSLAEPFELEGVSVTAVANCSEAVRQLTEYDFDSGLGVIVDFIVPQGDWRKPYLREPGIDFIKHAREVLGGAVQIVGFASGVTDELRRSAESSGADLVFEKTRSSLADVILAMKERCKERHSSRSASSGLEGE